MRRAGFIFMALMVMTGCDDPAPPTELSRNDCKRLVLVDQETGNRIRGAEDIAIDQEAGIAIISAYDRWAVERNVRETKSSTPQGGLYLVRLEDLRFDQDILTVEDISLSFKASRDFHPHGIDLHTAEDGQRTLGVINRRYTNDSRADEPIWKWETTLEIFRLNDGQLQHQRTVRTERLCRANDIVTLNANEFLFSRDHGACSDRSVLLEDIFRLSRGEIVRLTTPRTQDSPLKIEVIATDIGYANGLAIDREKNWLFVAATTEKAVRVYDLDAIGTAPSQNFTSRIEVSGGPDNLFRMEDGDLLVAIHPSLLAVGFYRRQWLGRSRAASRIIRLSPEDGRTRLLWDDPDGTLFSAATIAARLGPYLLIGSVADEGLTVCSIPE